MIKYLLEIKNRFFLLCLTYFSTIIVSYFYKEILLFLIAQPKYNFSWNNNKETFTSFYFIFTDVTEIFLVYIKLIVFISFQILVIFIIYHVFLFFIPALFKLEYKYSSFIIQIVFITWMFSLLIANYYLIPISWDFFLSFQNFIADKSFNIHFEAKLSEYFYFYISFYYVCWFYFQFSLLIFLILHYINQNINNIKKFRKLYYFSFVILATFLCPDFITQLLLSIGLIFIYEILLLVFLIDFFKKFN
jgi:sec-independent protein translocase protein TatC